MRATILLFVFSAVLAIGYGAEPEMTIAEATAFCEAEVPKYCKTTTCPQFCNGLRSAKRKADCNAQCGGSMCQLQPVVTATESRNPNQALIAQNRDQLWACIAEKRDPNNNKTGRRQTPWKELRTEGFRRATRP